jgi:hypothetical protein
MQIPLVAATSVAGYASDAADAARTLGCSKLCCVALALGCRLLTVSASHGDVWPESKHGGAAANST